MAILNNQRVIGFDDDDGGGGDDDDILMVFNGILFWIW